MMYDAKNGYGLQFLKADVQYEDCIVYRNSKEAIIRLADIIIRSFGYQGLMSELNEMQNNAMIVSNGECIESEVFANKFEIPSYFVNLLLKKHNMKVLGW